MKNSILWLAAVVATSTLGFAQAPASTTQTAPAAATPKGPDQLIERRAQYLAKELGLNADQQAKLRPILLAQRQDAQAMRQQVSTAGRRRGLAQDVKANQTRYDEQIRAVLTPAQYTRFDQLRAEQQEKMRDFRNATTAGQGAATQPAE